MFLRRRQVSSEGDRLFAPPPYATCKNTARPAQRVARPAMISRRQTSIGHRQTGVCGGRSFEMSKIRGGANRRRDFQASRCFRGGGTACGGKWPHTPAQDCPLVYRRFYRAGGRIQQLFSATLRGMVLGRFGSFAARRFFPKVAAAAVIWSDRGRLELWTAPNHVLVGYCDDRLG